MSVDFSLFCYHKQKIDLNKKDWHTGTARFKPSRKRDDVGFERVKVKKKKAVPAFKDRGMRIEIFI